MGVELRLRLLGGVAITRGGALVEGFVSAKAQALLCYLAVTARPHSRLALAGLLWGEMPERAARMNLRQALSNLRRLVGPHLQITRHTAAFDRQAPYWLDVEAFEAAIGQGLSGEELNPAPLEAAVDLYGGDFLAGLAVRGAPAFEEWVVMERERLWHLAVQALERLAAYRMARGEGERALGHLRRLLDMAPWREEIHRQVMHLLACSGQQSAALLQYETCRRILAEELGVAPAPETRALYEHIRLMEVTSQRHLPPQPTPFVGREEELAAIGRLLAAPDCRLLTLTGPGGIGKTRLALQAALQNRDSFLHGVCFVPLEAVPSVEHLVSAIAKALNLSFYGREAPRLQLVHYLQKKELLLVLDGFEHLLEGTDLVEEILGAAPGVKILVTSRQSLDLRWEWLFRVEGLKVPEEDAEARPETYSAVQLFAQIARRRSAEFSLEKEKEVAIRICRLVEGMPLGIEMAAGLVGKMPGAQLARELEQRWEAWTFPMRDAPRRHRSLQAVFDYSWNLLSEEERRVFRQLAVFQGKFPKAAAEEVVGASPFVLRALEGNSLLRQAGPDHYEWHSLLHQYAEEQLRAVPEEMTTVRDRHCRYYAAFLRRQERDFTGPEQKKALEAISAALDNLRAGWAWALEQGTLEAVADMVEGLHTFYDQRGWFEEGSSVFGEAASRLRTMAEGRYLPRQSLVLGKVLARQGWFLFRLGRYEEAGHVLQEGLSLLRPLGDPAQKEMAFCFNALGVLAGTLGKHKEAEAHFQESAARYRRVDFAGGVATALNNLGIVARMQGAYERARRFSQESLEIARCVEHLVGVANALVNLGLIAQAQKAYAQAEQLYREGLAMFRRLDDRVGVAISLANLGLVVYDLGRYQEAKAYYQENLLICREMGNRLGVAIAYDSLANVACAQGAYQEARELFAQALSKAREIGVRPLALDILIGMAALLSKQGEPEQALRLTAFVLEQPASEELTRQRGEQLLRQLLSRLPEPRVAAIRQEVRAQTFEVVADEALKRFSI